MTVADPGTASRVVVTRRLPGPWLAPLEAAGLAVAMNDDDKALTPGALRVWAAGASALWVQLTDRVDAALLDAAGPALKVVATYSVGVDHIDVDACHARGIVVAHTPDVLTDATADHTMMLLLGIARQGPAGHRLARSGQWRGWEPTQLLGMDLKGATLGIVGLGRIGAAVAQRARAFGMRIAYHQRRPRPDVAGPLEARYVADLDELVGVADVLTLHAPLTQATHHLLDERRLRLMAPHAIVVNTARGALIDEGALAAALREGRLGGAGLDVFEAEPRVHPGLLDLPNVVLSPHTGSATHGTRKAMAELCSSAIVAVLRGDRPPNAL
ncbi:MAG: D-glycerate dehydrogenase [bacterium]|nr:D-glycerate dehydrogenase [bacterium]